MKRLVVALACVVLLAGCGGGSGDAGTSTATAPTPTAAGDAVLAKAAVLRAPDVPAGWRESTDPTAGRTGPCAGVRRAYAAATARATGATFASRSMEVQSSVLLYADGAAAAGALRSLTAAGTRRCAAEDLAKQLGPAAGTPTSRAVGARRSGDETAAYEIVLPISGGGATRDVPIAFTFVRQGRGLAIVSASDVPQGSALARRIQAAATRRLQAALTS